MESGLRVLTTGRRQATGYGGDDRLACGQGHDAHPRRVQPCLHPRWCISRRRVPKMALRFVSSITTRPRASSESWRPRKKKYAGHRRGRLLTRRRSRPTSRSWWSFEKHRRCPDLGRRPRKRDDGTRAAARWRRWVADGCGSSSRHSARPSGDGGLPVLGRERSLNMFNYRWKAHVSASLPVPRGGRVDDTGHAGRRRRYLVAELQQKAAYFRGKLVEAGFDLGIAIRTSCPSCAAKSERRCS